MEEKLSILGLMVRDHISIDLSLKMFKENLKKDFNEMSEAFEEFKWEIKKHFFAEEKGIFDSYNNKDQEIISMIKHIMEEHDQIIEMLNDIESELSIKDDIEITGLAQMLEDHRKFEEESLYPKLDASLSENQKEEIIKKINEIPLKEQ